MVPSDKRPPVKSDLRPPPLQLAGLHARLKKEGVLPDRIFEQFSQGVAELWRRVGKYDQLLQGGNEKASSAGQVTDPHQQLTK